MHLSREALYRLFGGIAGEVEQDAGMLHLVTCPRCWNWAAKIVGELRDRGALKIPVAEHGQFILRMIETEEGQLVEELCAKGRWADLKELAPSERLRAMGKRRSFQTMGMVQVLLSETAGVGLTSPEEGEEIGRLVLAVIELLDESRYRQDYRDMLRAEAWAAIANCRRIGANWNGARTALKQAYSLIMQSTNDPLVRARCLSIESSLASDTGNVELALKLLDEAQQIYREAEDWDEVVKITVQCAYATVDSSPEASYSRAADALLSLSGTNSRLEMLARSLQTLALLEMGRLSEALRNHRACQVLYREFLDTRIKLAVTFIEGRLLEALNRPDDALQLYEQAATGFWEAELYKDLFLVKIHIFGFHLSRGAHAKAAEVCKDSLLLIETEGAAHEQMRRVWQELLKSLEQKLVDVAMVRTVREYIIRYWRVPAPNFPLDEWRPT